MIFSSCRCLPLGVRGDARIGVTSAGGVDRDGAGRGVAGRAAAAGVPPITSTVLAPDDVVIRNSSEAPGS
ncbi:hypothetical protein GCM10020369_40870 [Cryptosporangium minutisporangium]|uniref:Uncharacterized protein n=1 Tax=Cryptosporangium minutisporangium TaxID=113569 RepID=A0ABP6T0U9_9ACTN